MVSEVRRRKPSDPEAVFAAMKAAAGDLSPKLLAALERNGAVAMPARPEFSLPVLLCRTVVGQQLSVTAARAIWARLENWAGERGLLASLDEIEEGVLATDNPLRSCGLSGSKTKALRAIAQANQNGELDPAVLWETRQQGREAALCAIWGVGPWTAKIVCFRYFQDEDVWPDGDVTARKTLTRLTSPRRKTALTAARFKPYRTFLALQMWRTADSDPVAD